MANKGDWSEIYAFFKIIADGVIYPGDKNLNIDESFYYPVISIIKQEESLTKTFALPKSESGKRGNFVTIYHDDKLFKITTLREFENAATSLLFAIRNLKANPDYIHDTLDFMNDIDVHRIKARSREKADIHVKIYNSRVSLEQVLGFSIKSQLGSPATLFNAGATRLFFRLVGPILTEQQKELINQKTLIRDKISAIRLFGSDLIFDHADNPKFYNNLIIIDSFLPQILSYALLANYEHNLGTLAKVCDYLTSKNPLNFDQAHQHKFYEYKIKRLLSEIALGMIPSETWSGDYGGTQGYIIVKKDGNLVCYHIITRNLFEDYLLNNTYFETPSTTRHDFANIVEIDGQQFFALNPQIRFLK